jgi:signal transduction histidine kinase
MPPDDRAPRDADEKRSIEVEVLRLQLEANEQLVLATLRAHDELEAAFAARQRAEEDAKELRERGEELRVAQEFRERLIGIIGHDLRSPLTSIVMAGGLLIGRGGLSDVDSRVASRIVSSGQRMSRMIDQLVAFTRARLAGGFVLERAPSNLGDICRDIADELRINSPTEILQTTEGDLGGNWDAVRLAEVVSNIASNAVDHAAPGTPVVIRAREDGETVIAEITNQGASIPPDKLPVIFKPFRRAAEGNADAKPRHLGLGLYIACEIVTAHGGQLDVRSSDGSTTFTIRLPRACPA